jgi:hypothetical protein
MIRRAIFSRLNGGLSVCSLETKNIWIIVRFSFSYIIRESYSMVTERYLVGPETDSQITLGPREVNDNEVFRCERKNQ